MGLGVLNSERFIMIAKVLGQFAAIIALGIVGSLFLNWLGGQYVILPLDETTRKIYGYINVGIQVFMVYVLGYFLWRVIVLWRSRREKP